MILQKPHCVNMPDDEDDDEDDDNHNEKNTSD
jgi:hypothetical protein